MKLNLNEIINLLTLPNPLLDRMAEHCFKFLSSSKTIDLKLFGDEPLTLLQLGKQFEKEALENIPDFKKIQELRKQLEIQQKLASTPIKKEGSEKEEAKEIHEFKDHSEQLKLEILELGIKIQKAVSELIHKKLNSAENSEENTLNKKTKMGLDLLFQMRRYARFLIACIMVERLFTKGFKNKIDNQTQLNFSAWFKQATQGDCKEAKPTFDFKKPLESGKTLAKWTAWSKLKGKSKTEAQLKYIESGLQILEKLKQDPKDQKKLNQLCEELEIDAFENIETDVLLKRCDNLPKDKEGKPMLKGDENDLLFLCFFRQIQIISKLEALSTKEGNLNSPPKTTLFFSDSLKDNLVPTFNSLMKPDESTDKKDRKESYENSLANEKTANAGTTQPSNSSSAPGPSRTESSSSMPKRKTSNPT